MIIDCIGCLHGNYPDLEVGDLLIVTGDLTAKHTEKEWHEFGTWLDKQNYEKILFIAGNHDTMIEKWDKEQDSEGYQGPVSDQNDRIEYLCNSGTEFEGLKMWGTPHSLLFDSVNPKCTAFMGTEEELLKEYSKIPEGIDILISHCPPYGIYDQFRRFPQDIPENTGSISLMKCIERVSPKLVVFSHIHEHGGKQGEKDGIKYINCSYVNERYQPVNKVMRIII